MLVRPGKFAGGAWTRARTPSMFPTTAAGRALIAPPGPEPAYDGSASPRDEVLQRKVPLRHTGDVSQPIPFLLCPWPPARGFAFSAVSQDWNRRRADTSVCPSHSLHAAAGCVNAVTNPRAYFTAYPRDSTFAKIDRRRKVATLNFGVNGRTGQSGSLLYFGKTEKGYRIVRCCGHIRPSKSPSNAGLSCQALAESAHLLATGTQRLRIAVCVVGEGLPRIPNTLVIPAASGA
jgi:hypothetical protein